MPYNVSFGLIYNHRDSLLFTGLDQKNQAKDVPLQRPSYWHDV